MLKGKTTIELTDVNTGEKKVYEDHNMVTNFANYLFKNIGGLWRKERFYDSNSNYADSYYPYRTNMLGGLLLFDNEIDPKGGETIFAPTNARMVGCASYGNSDNTSATTNSKMRGNYNASESYYNSNEKTMKFVYDFSTSQANGTIKSACLTSIQGGYGGYEYPGELRYDNSSNGVSWLFRQNYYEYPLYIGEKFLYAINIDKNELYYHNIESTTSISIYTYDTGWYEKKILSSPYSIHKLKATDTYTIDINSMSYTAGFYDQKHNTLHVVGHTSASWANGVTLKVTKINLTDKTVENYTITNNTGVTMNLFYSNSSEPKSWKTFAYVYDNILYVWGGSNGVYRIDTTGVKETKQILAVSASSILFSTFNGRVLIILFKYGEWYSYQEHAYTYNPETDVTSDLGQNPGGLVIDSDVRSYRYGTIVPCIDCNDIIKYAIHYGRNFHGCFITLNNYLATINNLETPITKTNTNTMKVIYTIKEE